MTVEQIKAALKDRRLSVVSEATGLHPNTIANVRDGKYDPSHKSYVALVSYLEA